MSQRRRPVKPKPDYRAIGAQLAADAPPLTEEQIEAAARLFVAAAAMQNQAGKSTAA